jgi:hypothetical protein
MVLFFELVIPEIKAFEGFSGGLSKNGLLKRLFLNVYHPEYQFLNV